MRILDEFPRPARRGRAVEARERYDQLRAADPTRKHLDLLMDVAHDMKCDRSAVGRYLLYPDGAPPTKRGGRWSHDFVLEAVRAWRKQYGQVPSSVDWDPTRIRRLGWANAEERLQRHAAGWTDSRGVHQPFPCVHEHDHPLHFFTGVVIAEDDESES